MNAKEYYESILGTPEGALDLVRSGDVIATGTYASEPTSFLKELHMIAPRVEHVTLWTMLLMDHYPIMRDPSLKGHIDIVTYFYNDDCRVFHETGRYEMIPCNLHSVSTMQLRSRKPNVFAVAVSPMDEHGNVSIGFDLQSTIECMEAADRVIFEVNRQLPFIPGDGVVPITKATYLYEVDRPLPELKAAPVTAAEKVIGEAVASLIHDGDTIQLGIGGIPNAVGEALRFKHDLGLHSEMLTSSMGELIRCGAVTNARKSIDRGKCVSAFAFGDAQLYKTMAHSGLVTMRRAAYTNDPFVIMQNENLVSVNTALEIDLTGQVCSESIGPRMWSGTGGATDFAYGAYHAKGGRGILALTSTAKHGTISKIRPVLSPGAVVSISRNIVDTVITEYGIAHLRDRSIRQRVENLIAVAHPDFRAELRRGAEKYMLW